MSRVVDAKVCLGIRSTDILRPDSQLGGLLARVCGLAVMEIGSVWDLGGDICGEGDPEQEIMLRQRRKVQTQVADRVSRWFIEHSQ